MRIHFLFLSAALWSGTASAHHCIRDEYDEARFAEYSVTIDKVSWVNPHVIFTGKAVQPDGAIVKWEFEASSPNILKRSGLAADTVKSGDRVKIAAYHARNGANKGVVSRITFADGHKFEDKFSWDGWCPVRK